MAENRSCPECGTSLPSDAPGGLCPRCLMDAAMAGTADYRPANRPKGNQEGFLSPPEFRKALLELDLVEVADLDGLASGSGGDVVGLAKALVRAGRLTPYQAGAIVQGKAKGLLIGRYLVLDKLGTGGMGVVFRARHRGTRQVVALKILPPSFSRDGDAVRRFRREFQVAAHLKHPNIVAAIEADEDRGVHFLTMDYVQGRDLETLVQEDGPLSVKLALHCVIQIARGLEAAHTQGVVHRDIKPSNVMIDAAGNVRVCDLGLARITEATSQLGKEAGPSLTQTGAYMGSVDFLAPEQADDAKKADHRADIYSLGCTLYFLLTGHPPFPGDTILKRLIAHQERPAPSLRDHRPEVPAAMEAVYMRMMAKKPAERPVSMSQVIAALEACRSSPREAGDASADLKAFATTFMKRAAPKKRGPDASVFARPQESKGLRFDPDLNLEDLVHDYKAEIGHEEIPEEKLPPALPRFRPPKRRGKGRRLMSPLIPGVVFGLAAVLFFLYLTRPEAPRGPGVEPADPRPVASPSEASSTATGKSEFRLSDAQRRAPAPAPPRPATFRVIKGPDGDYPSLVASRAITPPVADGIISLGEYESVVPVDFRLGSTFGRMLEGMPDPATEKQPDDLSLELHAAYTDRAIFVACRVRDQVIDTDESDAKQPFFNDSVSLYLDGDQATNDFVFSNPGPRGSREGFQIVADAAGRKLTVAGDLTNDDWKAATSRTPDGYIIEFELPLAIIDTLDGDGTRPPGPGSLIRMGLAVEDYDLPKNARRAFGFLQAREGVKSPFFGQEFAWQMGLFLEPLAPAADPLASRGFLSLFNGRDLSGWKTHPSQPGNWRVSDGLLIGSGVGPSHLYSERGDYSDFHLRTEFRINAVGNSGVHFRTTFGPGFPASDPRYPEGYEASINYHLDTSDQTKRFGPRLTGTLYAGSRGVVVNVAEPVGKPLEWVTMDIQARGQQITISVNGKVVADYSDPNRTWSRGHIVLQCHDPKTAVEFRKIEIKPLVGPVSASIPATGPSPGPAPAGPLVYQDDFSDVSTGWLRNQTPIDGSPEPVRRNYDGQGVYFLEVPSKWTGFEAWDCTDPIDKPFQFEAVARTVGPAEAYGAVALILAGPEGRGFQVSINPGGKLAVYDSPWDNAGGKKYFEPFHHPSIKGGKQWNTITLRLRKRSLEVLVNGQAVCPPIATDYELLPSKPEIAVIKGDQTKLRAEFDRVEVRLLPAQ